MVTVNAVLGHWNANAYATLAAVDAYFDERNTGGAWPTDASTDDARKRAVIEASRQIDALPLKGPRLFNYGISPSNFESDLVRAVWGATSKPAGKTTGRQALQLPHRDMFTVSGTADAGASDDTTLIDSALALPTQYPSDAFVGGAVRITSGTGIWSHVTVSAFDPDTGTITVSSAFSSILDTTSTYVLMAPLPEDFIWGVAEQALYCYEGGSHQASQHISQGVAGMRSGDFSINYSTPSGERTQAQLVCPAAMEHLSKYLETNVRLKRMTS